LGNTKGVKTTSDTHLESILLRLHCTSPVADFHRYRVMPIRY